MPRPNGSTAWSLSTPPSAVRITFGGDLFDRFIEVHTLSHAFAQMIQITSLAFHEEWEKRGALDAPKCRRKPSEYLTSERVFYPAEASEWLLGPTVEALGSAGIFYASDFSHWDHGFPKNIDELQARRDLSEETKQTVLAGTARRMYALIA